MSQSLPMEDICVQRRVAPRNIPAARSLRRYARAAGACGALCLRIVDAEESRQLNRQFRGSDRPTNVLSFPAEVPAGFPEASTPPLGDLVLCAPVIAHEALAQGKPVVAHWAHMVVHGVLHLRGFDHEAAPDAQRMEDEERRILGTFGIADPY